MINRTRKERRQPKCDDSARHSSALTAEGLLNPERFFRADVTRHPCRFGAVNAVGFRNSCVRVPVTAGYGQQRPLTPVG
jgi:hypothetical protein